MPMRNHAFRYRLAHAMLECLRADACVCWAAAGWGAHRCCPFLWTEIEGAIARHDADDVARLVAVCGQGPANAL